MANNTIQNILEGINSLEMVIPGFQREYVQKKEQAKQLFVSLFKKYPTGSILFWETEKPPEIKNSAVSQDKIGWTKVILDGQQRLTTLRFIDEYKSRNENLADCMRRMRICEELGSGVDKAILNVEHAQLPAPEFLEMERHTKVILFAHVDFKDMNKNDRIRCCYQHCCLRYVSNDKMTNKSLRERFQIDARNSAMVSRVIDHAIKAELIKNEDKGNTSKKYAKYIPTWAQFYLISKLQK